MARSLAYCRMPSRQITEDQMTAKSERILAALGVLTLLGLGVIVAGVFYHLGDGRLEPHRRQPSKSLSADSSCSSIHNSRLSQSHTISRQAWTTKFVSNSTRRRMTQAQSSTVSKSTLRSLPRDLHSHPENRTATILGGIFLRSPWRAGASRFRMDLFTSTSDTLRMATGH